MVYNQPGSRRPSQVLALTGSPEVPGHRRACHHHNCDGQDEYSDSRWGVQGGFSLRWRLLRNLRCVLCHHLFCQSSCALCQLCSANHPCLIHLIPLRYHLCLGVLLRKCFLRLILDLALEIATGKPCIF